MDRPVPAVARERNAAQLYGIFRKAGLYRSLALRRLRSERPDAVILNPSAAGADTRALEAINASPARRLAYLSCDPTTLSRDLAVLIHGGFKLVMVQAIDMMPQTRQVEALALLRR